MSWRAGSRSGSIKYLMLLTLTYRFHTPLPAGMLSTLWGGTGSASLLGLASRASIAAASSSQGFAAGAEPSLFCRFQRGRAVYPLVRLSAAGKAG